MTRRQRRLVALALIALTVATMFGAALADVVAR